MIKTPGQKFNEAELEHFIEWGSLDPTALSSIKDKFDEAGIDPVKLSPSVIPGTLIIDNNNETFVVLSKTSSTCTLLSTNGTVIELDVWCYFHLEQFAKTC